MRCSRPILVELPARVAAQHAMAACTHSRGMAGSMRWLTVAAADHQKKKIEGQK